MCVFFFFCVEDCVPAYLSMERFDLEMSSLRLVIGTIGTSLHADDGDDVTELGLLKVDAAAVAAAAVLACRCSIFSNNVNFSKTEPVLL